MKSPISRYFVLICLWLSLCSCGSSTEATFVLVPTGPTAVSLGETVQFESTRPGVIWTVLGGPENGTIDPFGLYTAPSVMPAESSVTIIAQDDGDNSFAFIELQP